MTDNIMKLDDTDKHNDEFSEVKCGYETSINGTLVKCSKIERHYGKHYCNIKFTNNNSKTFDVQFYWQEIPDSI